MPLFANTSHRRHPQVLRGGSRRARRFASLLPLPLALTLILDTAQAGGHDPAATPMRNWTPASLRQALAALPPGDAGRGQALNRDLFCASCHGNEGVAPTLNWPHLAGQKVAYTAKMMLDYQSGPRQEGERGRLMHDVGVVLSPQEIADLAAYYASLPAPRESTTPRPVLQPSATDLPAAVLVRKGDPSRLITPCASCHGAAGEGGRLEAPVLAGQNPRYFPRTLLDYQHGIRANDGKKTMRAFTRGLTPAEIAALAVYYADLPLK